MLTAFILIVADSIINSIRNTDDTVLYFAFVLLIGVKALEINAAIINAAMLRDAMKGIHSVLNELRIIVEGLGNGNNNKRDFTGRTKSGSASDNRTYHRGRRRYNRG